MSKTKEESQEKKFHTIKSYFESFLEDDSVRIFNMSPYGQFWAATKKPNGDTKKPARGMIGFPSDGSLGETTDLRFLRDWSFVVVAIPKNSIEKLNKKRDEKENVKNNK